MSAPAITANTSRYTATILNVVVRTSLPSAVTDHVSGAAHRMEERLVEALVDLGAQPRHVHVDHVGLRVEVIVPHVLEQHGAGDHLAGVAHEIFQKPELAPPRRGSPVTRTSSAPSPRRIRTGVALPRARRPETPDRPSRLGSIRSTMR